MSIWPIYQGTGKPHDNIDHLPDPPSWRRFDGKIPEKERKLDLDPQLERRFGKLSCGQIFVVSKKEIEDVNAAICLRRPLLVTGKPGTGKSSLAYAVAYELKLGRVLHWPITSRSILQEGLYRYDAIGRLQEANLNKNKETPEIGKFVRLGQLGTALLPSKRPRVLLIDEIDKSDIDFPNDLLNVFEDGEFEIPELARLSDEEVSVLPYDGQEMVTIKRGRVVCHAFPFVVLTSNGEREFPPPFLRRCLRLEIEKPSREKLVKIVNAYFSDLDEKARAEQDKLITMFLERGKNGDLATDQLLNAIYLTTKGVNLDPATDHKDSLLATVLKYLNTH